MNVSPPQYFRNLHLTFASQIFGHTGMKAFDNSAEWANYPGEFSTFLPCCTVPKYFKCSSCAESAVWMVHRASLSGHLSIRFNSPADAARLGSLRLHQRRRVVEGTGLALNQGTHEITSKTIIRLSHSLTGRRELPPGQAHPRPPVQRRDARREPVQFARTGPNHARCVPFDHSADNYLNVGIRMCARAAAHLAIVQCGREGVRCLRRYGHCIP